MNRRLAKENSDSQKKAARENIAVEQREQERDSLELRQPHAAFTAFVVDTPRQSKPATTVALQT